MKLFWLLFLAFFLFYSFFGEVKITYTYKNEKKEEKTGNFIESLLVVIILSVLSSGFVNLVVIAISKFFELLLH